MIQSKDGTDLPVLPADLAPKTTAIPRAVDDTEATLRLPQISEQLAKK